VWVHWGDLKVRGDVNLGAGSQLPVKTVQAPVGEQSYADTSLLQDRWLDVWVGGNATMESTDMLLPENVHANQEPAPGLRMDRWDYETMKRQAILYGAYYVPDADGLLYRNGMVRPGVGLTATEVFNSTGLGDHRGLVFIDTLDQHAPDGRNLAALSVESEYSEGLFIVNGDVHWKPKGQGKSVPALSPPPEESASLGARVPTLLPGIHLQGVLSVAGNLMFEGRPHVFGAVMTDGDIVANRASFDRLEVWFNYDLRSGIMRGMPVVQVARGTWQERY
jgi:hypothetical protein